MGGVGDIKKVMMCNECNHIVVWMWHAWEPYCNGPERHPQTPMGKMTRMLSRSFQEQIETNASEYTKWTHSSK